MTAPTPLRPPADLEEDALVDVYRKAHAAFGDNEQLWTPAEWDAVHQAMTTVHADFEQVAA